MQQSTGNGGRVEAALRRVVPDVLTKIERSGGLTVNEQNTKTALIEPVLTALGWSVTDWDEVYKEYKPKAADNPVDYALLVVRTPRLFIEAKALGENLDDRRWAGQIMGYATVAGVEWVVLTNGDEYRIYNAHASVPVEEKLFRAVRLSGDQDDALATLLLLSKERLVENAIDSLWRAEFIDRQVRSALEGLFSPTPDQALIRLVGKRLPRLSPADVRASLGRVRVRLDFPLEDAPGPKSTVVGASPAAPTPAVANARPALQRGAGGDSTANIAKAAQRVTLGQLLDASLLRVGQEIEADYKERRFVATVEGPERIRLNGAVYPTLSAAGSAVREAVLGPREDGAVWAINGWGLWMARDQDGRRIVLDALRTRLAASRR